MSTRTIDLMGLYDVARWGVIKVLRPQSVAEHTFGVIVIAAELVARLGMGDADLAHVMYWALIHDVPETLSCDIDGKFKRDFPDVRSAVIKAENTAFPWYKAEANDVTPQVNAIVKTADIIESIHYIRTWGHGSRADDVKRELTKILFTEQVPRLVGALREAHGPDLVDVNSVKFLVGDILNQSLLESGSIQFR